MTGLIGSSLAHYSVVSLLGRGGMGEVYRARDSKLGRDVAIKVLPAAFASDPDRAARLQREARTLASLNHPNIAAIHGIDEAGGRRFLVMELVEGEDLSQRLAHGPIPLDEALEIARQIADGLEEAHERGIVHRDLKPANVKLTSDGKVKILDFGLARALLGDATGDSADLMNSPTMPVAGTMAGTILGTAAYMSPEQARGRAVDRRADLWAFGVILFEMLAGRQLFGGETVSDTLASVLKTDPDFAALPAGTPPAVRRVLARCLTKDPRRRLRSAADAALELEGAPGDAAAEASGAAVAATAGAAVRGRAWTWIPWALAVLALTAAALALRSTRRTGGPVPGDARLVRAEIALPVGERAVPQAPPAISPDGRWLVYGKRDAFGAVKLRLRALERFDDELLPDLDDAAFPFWSPDSRSLGYFVRGSLRRLDLDTRASSVLSEATPWARGGSWGPGGSILFAPDPNAGIHLIPATGGADVAVTTVDTTLADASHRFPCWLPDGEHFLFTLWSNNAEVQRTHGGVYVASIQGGAPARVLPDASSCVYVKAGFLLVHRSDRLVAVPFDPRTRQAGSPVVPVDAEVMFGSSMGVLAVSASDRGDLAYAVGDATPPAELAWLDRNGQLGATLGVRGTFAALAIAPDGRHVAAERDEGMNPTQIWVGDLARATITPLTHSDNDSYGPVWSPDSERVAYSCRDSGDEDIYVQSASGTMPRQLLHNAREHDTDLSDWSADGRYLFFSATSKAGGPVTQVWIHDFQQGQTRGLLTDNFQQRDAHLSPDGRWLAYVSNESGRPEVYLRPFPALDRKWPVSTAGGSAPHFSRDGRELMFVASDEHGLKMMSVTLGPDAGVRGEPRPSLPREQFAIGAQIVELTPMPDHSRLLAAREVDGGRDTAVRLVLDWARGLRAPGVVTKVPGTP